MVRKSTPSHASHIRVIFLWNLNSEIFRKFKARKSLILKSWGSSNFFNDRKKLPNLVQCVQIFRFRVRVWKNSNRNENHDISLFLFKSILFMINYKVWFKIHFVFHYKKIPWHGVFYAIIRQWISSCFTYSVHLWLPIYRILVNKAFL